MKQNFAFCTVTAAATMALEQRHSAALITLAGYFGLLFLTNMPRDPALPRYTAA